MLEVHGGLLAWTVITFLLLLVVLKKIAWGPILTALEARESEIKDALNAAEKAREEAERVSSDYEESIRKAQSESQQIIAEAKSAGEKVRSEIEKAANVKADEIVDKAKILIDAERVKAINEIKTVAVEISMSAASKLIEKNLDSEDNRKLVKEALEGIGQA